MAHALTNRSSAAPATSGRYSAFEFLENIKSQRSLP
jgi:hypothetical protein